MRYLLILFPFILPCIAMAQPGWSKGYVITNSQDTLYGKIYYSTPGQRSAKCLFKEEGYNVKVKYLPFTIKGYFVNNTYYASRIYDIHPSLSYGLGVFMEVLNMSEYPVQILHYWNTDSEFGYRQIFLVRSGEPSFEVNPFRWKDSVATYFKDCPDLERDILAGKYKKRDLLEITRRYNAWKLK